MLIAILTIVVVTSILVTGVAGFVGSHTAAALLQKGARVIGVDNLNDYYSPAWKLLNLAELREKSPERFRFFKADILDTAAMEEIFASEKIDRICHLAARAGLRESVEKPLLYEQTNIGGTLRMLELARKYDVAKFVYASSSAVYGDAHDVPFCEDRFLRPISPYGATKLANENDAHIYSRLHGLSTVGLRFFTAYGPKGRPDMAPYLFTDAIARGLPIKKFGDGSTARDYTFVEDIVEGILAALEYETDFEIFNLGNGSATSLNDFIALVEDLLGKKAIIEQNPMQPGDVTITYADITKAHKHLGYAPKTSLEEGMRRFVEWYQTHEDH